MKKYTSILFDLDGTLTQSGIGITRSAAFALESLGLPVPEEIQLNVFVGPPLRETFPKFGVKQEEIDKAIQIFRSRYTTIGKFENTPYEGIQHVLETLQSNGYHLYVATSKPQQVAIEILEHFHLTMYFDEIIGASLDASRESKEDVIAYLLEKIGNAHCIMVGDTDFDVIGAKKNGMDCIGVSWGYGKEQSMIDAGAIQIAHTMEELLQILQKDA